MPQPRDPGRPRDRPAGDRPEYTVYRSRPGLLARLRRGERFGGLDDPRAGKPQRPRFTWRRVALIAALVLAGWLGVSLVLFLISAQIERGKVSDAARDALDDAGNIVLSGQTILVLGSDARPPESLEGGANKVGDPSRADTIMLVRVGGGRSARLSIPRDTVVDIPGAGRNKINAAYAIGGPQLTIRTVKEYLGIDVHHLIEVNFDTFPDFIDALGGIDFTARRCVRAKVDGGAANGGVTIRLRRGQTKRLNGREVLALSRVRFNDCSPRENDLDRARRQQEVLSAIKDRIASTGTFFRLPWVSWKAPQAIRSDMGGPTLLGLALDVAVGGSPAPRVLEPSGFENLPNGGQGVVIPEEERRTEVRRFLKG